jgi:hypothetical protein
MDFTLKQYEELLKAITQSGYCFLTFSDYLKSPKEKSLILRHDVDKNAENALMMAQLEAEMGVRATYYFRIKTVDVEIVKEIAVLGHEIGYHYEDLSHCKGNNEKAFDLFQQNLSFMRQYANIQTVAMHGSPLSKIDNRMLWKTHSYRELGLVGEPYFDFIGIDGNVYFTDTGRSWNSSSNLRDKAINKEQIIKISSTNELISFLKENTRNVMISAHPQRWSDNYFSWFCELLVQSVKNIVKKILSL